MAMPLIWKPVKQTYGQGSIDGIQAYSRGFEFILNAN